MARNSTPYEQARRLGLACAAQREAEHQDPDLPVLDKIIENYPAPRQKRLGVQEILTSRIVGTCHNSRTESFAYNFMPLLEEESEFAMKWNSLYHSALEEGLHEPIIAYALFGRYFVEEGNKRVSVMKFLNNPLISAQVIELTLNPNDLPEGDVYEGYLKFCQATGVSCLLFANRKDYRKLLKILDASQEHPFDAEEKQKFLSLFYSFESVFDAFKEKKPDLKATSSDAFLIFLEVYGWQPDKVFPDSELRKELESLWPAIEAFPQKRSAALLTDTDLSDRKPRLSFLREPVAAALITQGNPASSSWSASHFDGFAQMKDQLKDNVRTMVYTDANTPQEVEKDVREAISRGAQVIFTSHPMMLQITNQLAAKYPRIKFLNCSLNPDSAAVRTYYTRGYEILFLQGMAAGALTTTPAIGYIADYPIYGAVADINAFALGVNMVRPDARVYLDWSTTESPTNQDFPLQMDFLYISGQDFDTRIRHGKRFGLFDVRQGKFMNIASTDQHWNVFYSQVILSLLNRTYFNDEQLSQSSSINYWLGLSNGLIDITLSDQLPQGLHRLIQQIKNDLLENRFFIFEETVPDLSQPMPLDRNAIAKMDWLVDNVMGVIPGNMKFVREAEELVKVHGVDTSQEEDEKENLDDERKDPVAFG